MVPCFMWLTLQLRKTDFFQGGQTNKVITRYQIQNLVTFPSYSLVWGCAAKGRQWFGEEMYEVWRMLDQEVDRGGLGERLWRGDCQASGLNRGCHGS